MDRYSEVSSQCWKGSEMWQKLEINKLGGDRYKAFLEACSFAITSHKEAKEKDRKDDIKVINTVTKNFLETLQMSLAWINHPSYGHDYRCYIVNAYAKNPRVKVCTSPITQLL